MNTLNRGYQLKKKRLDRIVGTLILLSFFFIWNYNEQVSLSSTADANEIKKELKFNSGSLDLSSTVKYGRYNQSVTAYKSQVIEMYNRGYDTTTILDLLANKSMECNQYDGMCYGMNNADLGPFQINQIHKEQYNHSLKLMRGDKREELFKYQLTYAKGLVDSYMDRYCNSGAHESVGLKYTNENRYKCVAKSYNGSQRYKHTYAEIGWLKRQIISDWLLKNSNLFAMK